MCSVQIVIRYTDGFSRGSRATLHATADSASEAIRLAPSYARRMVPHAHEIVSVQTWELSHV